MITFLEKKRTKFFNDEPWMGIARKFLGLEIEEHVQRDIKPITRHINPDEALPFLNEISAP